MNPAIYINLTMLGQIYGVSAQEVGRWLKGLGLRNQDGWPSREASANGFVMERVLEFGGSSWLWHQDKTCEVLDGMCYRRGGQLQIAEQHDGFVLIRGS